MRCVRVVETRSRHGSDKLQAAIDRAEIKRRHLLAGFNDGEVVAQMLSRWVDSLPRSVRGIVTLPACLLEHTSGYDLSAKGRHTPRGTPDTHQLSADNRRRQ